MATSLKPHPDLRLCEWQRVRILFETIDDEVAEDREAMLAHLRAGITRVGFFS